MDQVHLLEGRHGEHSIILAMEVPEARHVLEAITAGLRSRSIGQEVRATAEAVVLFLMDQTCGRSPEVSGANAA